MYYLTTHAAWVLLTAFSISFIYEIYRATVKKGTSSYDNPRFLLIVGVPFYVVSLGVTALLFANFSWANWVALGYTLILIGVAMFFYSPTIALKRKPALIDWLENLVYLGLLFSAATILVYSVFQK